jgi:general secretion pathway protein I
MRARGFSLLEVMVAVSILGLALTVILSAQGGLAASNKMAANMGMATGLSRCKMTELEEKMLKLGYPELDQIDNDILCCEGMDAPGFNCDTRVEKILLPNPPQNSLGDGGFMSDPAALASGAASGSGLAGLPPIPGMTNPAGGPGLNLDIDSGLQNIGGQLQNQLTAMGGSQGLLTMVMGIVYPSLKPMLETSIRRVTVKVKWKEGSTQKDFSIVQYVTNPQRSGFASGVPGADGGVAGIPGLPGAPGAPGAIPGAPGAGPGAVPGTPPVTTPIGRQ